MSNKMNPKALIMTSVLLVGIHCASAGGRIIYVDADAPGPIHDGSSWLTAYKHLQDGLADASSNGDVNEIRVAQGIYKPDEDTADPDGTGDRAATFQLINSVAVKGGYAGSDGDDPNVRDFELHETILSGDLNNDDGPDFANNGDNSYHVVTLQGQQDVRIDGFTITGGKADSGRGAGMAARNWPSDCSGVIANCRFENNWASSHGGGLNLWGSVDVISCTFSGNVSYSYGGGISMEGHNSYSKIKNCTFQENISEVDSGGGICVWSVDGEVTISDCVFVANVAKKGGAIEFETGADTKVSGCIFKENVARGVDSYMARGGAIKILHCTLVINNCLFTNNSSTDWGGAIANYGVSRLGRPGPVVTNCTFTGNSAKWGGAISNLYYSDPDITNCILWDDTASLSGGEVYSANHSYPSVSYCDVQGNYPGLGNIDADPCFVNPDADDYHLRAESPCVDAGDNNSVPPDAADLDGDGNTTEPIPWDFEESPRIMDGDSDGNSVVDMGAYELFSMSPVAGPDPPDCSDKQCVDVTPCWTGGEGMGNHAGDKYYVYLGTNYEDVNNAGIGDPEYCGFRSADVECFDPDADCGVALELWTHYYWRIDEKPFGHETVKGPVWHFMTGCREMPGDINLDCVVDGRDFAMLADDWMTTSLFPDDF